MGPIVSVMGTLHRYIVDYLAGRVARGEITRGSAESIAKTLRTLNRSFGDRPMSQYSPKAIDRWLESIGTFAPATRREYLSRVRGFSRWLIAEGVIATDPTAHVPAIRQPRTVPVTLSESQVAALLAVCPDRRARAIVWLLVGVGCRCIEVERMRVEDYDPGRRVVLLRGKGDNEREVPVPSEVCRAIDDHLDRSGRRAGSMFVGERGGLKSATIGTYVRRWMRDAGIKTTAWDGRSAHGLRRTAGSDVMERCGDVRVVQAMLGHARVETTARHYLRPVPLDSLRDAMEGRKYAS